jgi:hypothetical protein
MATMETPAPRTFAEGLIGGFGRGLGGSAAQAGVRRQKLEATTEARRAARDEENLRATQEFRRERTTARRDLFKARLDAEKTPKTDRWEMEHTLVGPGEVSANPSLKSLEGRWVPNTMLKLPEEKSATEEGQAVTLTPAGLDAAAIMYAKTGQLPAMGMSRASAGVRGTIINRAASMFPNLDVAANKGDYSTNVQALSGMKKIQAGARAYQSTVTKNADVLLETMKKIPDTGSPLFNQPIRALSRKVLGKEELAAFDAARQVVMPEFARLLNNPNLTGQLTDEAREEIERIVSGNYSLKQMAAALRTLKRDSRIRIKSYDDAITSLSGQLKSMPGSTIQGGAESRTAPATMKFNPATGKVEPIGGP